MKGKYSYLIDQICTGEKTPDIVRRMIPILVGWAKSGQTNHTYGELLKALGYKAGYTGFGTVLGKLELTMKELRRLTGEKDIPSLNSLVNNKHGLPSDGFSFVLDGYETYSENDKREYARLYNHKAVTYPKWDWVLAQFGLSPAISLEDEQAILSGKVHGYGGEGAEHKALKEYIASHPRAIGLDTDEQGDTEHAILSGDSLDVYFKEARVAVEVKPGTSPDPDILRGIYQCVKYKAVLDAMAATHGDKPIDRCILVMAGQLSGSNTNVKQCLGVTVIENFKM